MYVSGEINRDGPSHSDGEINQDSPSECDVSPDLRLQPKLCDGALTQTVPHAV